MKMRKITCACVSVCTIFLIIYGAWFFSPATYGQEGIPAGATMLKEINFDGTVECNTFCGGGLSNPYDQWLSVDGGIYKIDEDTMYIKVTISRPAHESPWDYTLKIRDSNGVLVANYSNSQEKYSWTNDELGYTVAKKDGFSFELTGTLSWSCCSDYSSYFDVFTQTTVYDCHSYTAQESVFTGTQDISFIDWTLIIVIIVGIIIAVAVAATLIARRGGGDSTDRETRKMMKHLRWK